MGKLRSGGMMPGWVMSWVVWTRRSASDALAANQVGARRSCTCPRLGTPMDLPPACGCIGTPGLGCPGALGLPAGCLRPLYLRQQLSGGIVVPAC